MKVTPIIRMFMVSILIAGCGKQESRQLTPTQEAYRLMDRGDNAKAVVVLEHELRIHPGNTEARELLGSAFVGLAGLDIYSIHEAFQDILFRRSIKDAFFGGTSDASTAIPASSSLATETGGEKLIKGLDGALVSVQKVMLYLSRFPQIPRAKWPYLDKALIELDDLRGTSALAVYRILIRMVYLKSFLVEEVIRDTDFGTKRWACTFEPASLREGLQFVNEQIDLMRADVTLAIKLGAKKLGKGDSVFASVINATNLAEAVLALENSRTIRDGESRLRARLGCEKIP